MEPTKHTLTVLIATVLMLAGAFGALATDHPGHVPLPAEDGSDALERVTLEPRPASSSGVVRTTAPSEDLLAGMAPVLEAR